MTISNLSKDRWDYHDLLADIRKDDPAGEVCRYRVTGQLEIVGSDGHAPYRLSVTADKVVSAPGPVKAVQAVAVGISMFFRGVTGLDWLQDTKVCRYDD